MIKKLIGIILLSMPLILQAESTVLQLESSKVQPGQQCKALTCIRGYTNNIDNQLVELMAERLGYMGKPGELTTQTISVYDRSKQRDDILNNMGNQLEAAQYRSGIAKPIYKTILEQTDYQDSINNNPDDNPTWK